MNLPMYDSIRPASLPRNKPAALYINGDYSCPRSLEQEFGRVVRISVEPGQPEAARFARILDVERWDATPADVPEFVHFREALGHHDATIYASAASVGTVLRACGPAYQPPRWWVAWWWNRPVAPTREQVAAEVHQASGADIDPATIWACQYASYSTYDLSVVYGPRDFSR